MSQSDRSEYLTHWISRALILAVVVSVAGGTLAASEGALTAERSDEGRLSAGPGRSSLGMTTDSSEAEIAAEADVSTENLASAPPRPRAEASFPQRPLQLPVVRAVSQGSGTARPLTLASGDFDGDGVEDLICGFATADGGLVKLYAGNVDAIFPHSPVS